jgi:hypothetical protein
MATHQPTSCTRTGQPLYVNRGWKAKFACPACARTTYQHLSYLGRRSVVCDGVRFTKQPKQPVEA